MSEFSEFSEATAADAVTASFADTPDPRLREIVSSLTKHLHAFIKEIEPTQREWERGVAWLTAVGHMSDGERQEFILASDVLGVSMLVDAINNRKPPGATESTVLGPFHVVESPERALGDTISLDGKGDECVVAGRILGPDGAPIPGAEIDVWQASADGFYDVQQPGVQPPRNLRGLFTADDEGRYRFRTVVPSHYSIPDDGPVGELLRATGRHPYRPAHIHFIVQAPGRTPLTTHLFVEGSPYLDSDAVFGVKRSLIRSVRTVDDPSQALSYGTANPFRFISFDVTLS